MSTLIAMNKAFPHTQLWCDSFHIEDHKYALTQGIYGITTSPTWVSRMMCEEPTQEHVQHIQALQKKHPQDSAQELLWRWTLDMAKARKGVMEDAANSADPTKGRFSVQCDIHTYNNKDRMLNMAREIDACGDCMQVKIPATQAGIQAMEKATYEGISVMATLCFSVDQALCVAQAIERALARRQQEGLCNDRIHPVCAVLLGMQDDWLKMYTDKHNLVVHPDALNYGGVAIAKKVYTLYKERGYQTRILTAYYRHSLHFSSFIGGDIIMSIPTKWQRRFETCDIEIKDHMREDIPTHILSQLNTLPPFVQAYTEGSLREAEFAAFPPVVLTLHYFMEEYDKALIKVRNAMLIKP